MSVHICINKHELKCTVGQDNGVHLLTQGASLSLHLLQGTTVIFALIMNYFPCAELLEHPKNQEL